MTRGLNLADIQGNVLSAYGKQGFPRARYVFLHVEKEEAGRAFITGLLPRITTALRWKSKKDYPGEIIEQRPAVAWNLAFTWWGLRMLGLPTITLRSMPPEFIDGMARRGDILGDRPDSKVEEIPAHWDAIWRGSAGKNQVHILLSLNAGFDPENIPKDKSLQELMAAVEANLDEAYQEIVSRCDRSGGGIYVLPGHGPQGAAFQDAHVLFENGQPTKREHFGFADGFGDPVFKGQYPEHVIAGEAIGQGKLLPGAEVAWEPLATGEFLLGYVDEAQEIPGKAYPFEFTRNGTFMAYRKLHENVASFRRWVDDTARAYARHQGLSETTDFEQARQTLIGKIGGRWPEDGVPLTVAPTWAEYKAFQQREQTARKAGDKAKIAEIKRQYVDFVYRGDMEGAKCPVASHMRRTNPRDFLDPKLVGMDPKLLSDSLDPVLRNNLSSKDRKKLDDLSGSALNNRRRILRRGLPYGAVDPENPRDDGEHGIIFMAVCASLFRQFEFVQQQWIQYGLDFNVGNDTCPLHGNHDADAKLVIPADPGSGKPPFIAAKIPQLVEVRGGDYFFIPSMTGLRMLGLGIVDPT